MRLTYLDILEQVFHDKWRGYDKKEVDTFLHLVAEDFKALTQELEELRHQVEQQEKKIRQLESANPKGRLEGLNPEALKEKARKIISLARQEADQHLKEVDQELSRLKGEVDKLRREKSKLIESIKRSARSYVQGRARASGEPASHEPARPAS